MSQELPAQPRKIGKHFTFYGLKIAKIGNETCASVEYGYEGKHLKRRTGDASRYIEKEVLSKIIEPIGKEGIYDIYSSPLKKELPKDKFKIGRKNEKFEVRINVDGGDDKIKVTSLDGASISSFRNFLLFLEASMCRYEE